MKGLVRWLGAKVGASKALQEISVMLFAELEQKGYVLVPVKPTGEMLDAGYLSGDRCEEIWAAMVEQGRPDWSKP